MPGMSSSLHEGVKPEQHSGTHAPAATTPKVQSRVAVYFPKEGVWREGTVTKVADSEPGKSEKDKEHKIKYDNKEKPEWTQLTETKWRYPDQGGWYEGPPGPGSYEVGATATSFGSDSRKPVMGPSTRPQPLVPGEKTPKGQTLKSRRYHNGATDGHLPTPGPGPGGFEPKGTHNGPHSKSQAGPFAKSPTYRNKVGKKDQHAVTGTIGPGSYDKIGMRPDGSGAIAGGKSMWRRNGFHAPAQPFGSEAQRSKPGAMSPRFLDKTLSSGPDLYGTGVSPGPQAYEKNETLGTAWRGMHRPDMTNPPKFSMSPRSELYLGPLGTLPRPRDLSQEVAEKPVAFGKQVDASRESRPQYRFGKGPQRTEVGKKSLFLGKEQEHAYIGYETLGVATLPTGLDHDKGLSRKVIHKRSPRFGFGTESRF